MGPPGRNLALGCQIPVKNSRQGVYIGKIEISDRSNGDEHFNRVGVIAKDTLARAPLWTAGLDFDHGTGHGVGAYLGVHEGPHGIAARGAPVKLRPGMVISNEPGYYRSGSWGIRIENLVTVVDSGIPEGGERRILALETITLAPIDRNLVDPGLMTPDEAAWFDAYHARVRETLSPLVDGPTREWLDAATAPIA